MKSAPGRGFLFYDHGRMIVKMYIDADWANSTTNRRSTSGYCSFMGDNLVTWRNKKQLAVARFSADVEYKSMARGVCEVFWLRTLLQEIGFVIKVPLS